MMHTERFDFHVKFRDLLRSTFCGVSANKRQAQRFLNNRDGNIAMLFAFMSGMLFLFIGGAVDYARWNAVRADMVESMDAASLAVAQLAASDPSLTNVELIDYGTKFFNENFKYESKVNGFSLDFNLANKAVISTCIQGNLDTHLLRVAGITKLDVDNCVEITRRGSGRVELALVLDVTGSMNSSISGKKKIDSLKDAVTEMLDVMYGTDPTSTNIKLAVVPFNAYVNAGGASSWQDGWSDINAMSYYHGARFFHVDENGDVDMNTKVNHFRLFDSTPGASWKGCVEARPYPLDELDIATNGFTNSAALNGAMVTPSVYIAGSSSYDIRNRDAFDDAPAFALPASTVANSDNLRFVPVFHPDEPDCNNSDDCDNGDYSESGTIGGINWAGVWFDDPDDDNAHPSGNINESSYSNRYFINDYNYLNYNQGTPFAKYVKVVKYFRDVIDPAGPLSDPAFEAFMEGFGVDTSTGHGYGKQEYILRNAYVGWWNPATQEYDYKYDLSPSFSSGRGPNHKCSTEILPLTNVRADIENHVNALTPDGYTNSANGAMWGWRVLSNEPPFEEGIGSADPDFDDWQKAVVIMTDGENTIENLSTHWDSGPGANGFAIESRMGANMTSRTDMRNDIDNKLLRICHRMKEEGYLVYTIMFGLNSSSTELAFRSCATAPNAPYFYNADNGADLEQAFGDIAADLVDLHVSK